MQLKRSLNTITESYTAAVTKDDSKLINSVLLFKFAFLFLLAALLISSCSSSSKTASVSVNSITSNTTGESITNPYGIDVAKLGSLTNYSALQYASGSVTAYLKVHSTSNCAVYSSQTSARPQYIFYKNTQYVYSPTVSSSGQVSFTWQPAGQASYTSANPYPHIVQNFVDFL